MAHILKRSTGGSMRLFLATVFAALMFYGTAEAAGTNLTSGISPTSASTYTTASISPGANNLDVVSVESFSGTAVAIPTVTGAGGTWVQIATQVSASNSRRVTLFRDLSASPGSGPLTIDFGGQLQNANVGWSVDEFSGVDTSGTHGSGAILQSVGALSTTTSTGITVNLAALSSPNNSVMGYVRTNQLNPITAGAGFTELSQQTATGATAEAEWALNQTAVAWTWASQTVNVVALAIEVKAAAPITFGATTSSSCGPGPCTATVSVPAGTVNGDVMLMFETNSESGPSCITPTGWTAVTSNTYSPGAAAACPAASGR